MRTIAWICVFGISLGLMSLLIVISVMNGFNRTIRERLLAVEPHLVVSMPDLESLDKSKSKIQSLSSLQNELKEAHGVDTALVEGQDVIIRTLEGTFGGAIARGMDASTLKKVLHDIELASERHRSRYVGVSSPIEERSVVLHGDGSQSSKNQLKVESTLLGPKEIIIGSDLAQSLRILEGDQVMVIPAESLLLPSGETPRFEMVNVKSLLSSRVGDIDSKFIFFLSGGSISQIKRSSNIQQDLELRFDDPNDYILYEKNIRNRGFQTANWQERNQALFFALTMEKLAMSVFLILTAFITCFSIITVLVLLWTQKQRELGILMAMGLSQRRARELFTRIGMILSLLGMGSGVVAGLLVCFLLDRYPIDLLPDIYYDSSIPVMVTRELVFVVIVCCLLVAFMSSYFPARANTTKWPALALRKRK